MKKAEQINPVLSVWSDINTNVEGSSAAFGFAQGQTILKKKKKEMTIGLLTRELKNSMQYNGFSRRGAPRSGRFPGLTTLPDGRLGDGRDRLAAELPPVLLSEPLTYPSHGVMNRCL